jgi:hypothetical protein
VKSEAWLGFFHDPEMDPAGAGSIKGVGGWVILDATTNFEFDTIATALRKKVCLIVRSSNSNLVAKPMACQVRYPEVCWALLSITWPSVVRYVNDAGSEIHLSLDGPRSPVANPSTRVN